MPPATPPSESEGADQPSSFVYLPDPVLVATCKASIFQLGDTEYSYAAETDSYIAFGDFAILIRDPDGAKKFFAECAARDGQS